MSPEERIAQLEAELTRERARADGLQEIVHALTVKRRSSGAERQARVTIRPEVRGWYERNPGIPPPEQMDEAWPTREPLVRMLTPEEQAARRAEHERDVSRLRDENEERRRLKARRWVYFMQERGNPLAPIKIGISRDVERRRGELQRAENVVLSCLATMEGTVCDEQAFHARFAAHRLHGEWFTPAPEILAQVAVLNGVKQ